MIQEIAQSEAIPANEKIILTRFLTNPSKKSLELVKRIMEKHGLDKDPALMDALNQVEEK